MKARKDDRDAVIVGAVRTPIGRYGGSLSSVRPDDLAAGVIHKLMTRYHAPADQIDDVILGCANQAGEDNRNVARMAALLAGLPEEVPGTTVNRLCGSGLEAVWTASRTIRAGEGDLFVAGGVESMSRAPLAMMKPDSAFPRGPSTLHDTALGWRFPNPRMEERFPLEGLGETAENVAARFQITRQAQDAYALASHRRAVAAAQEGRFAEELAPVEVRPRKGEPFLVEADEGPRADTDIEKLGSLKPVFRNHGTVTAGNSSPLSDGAAAVLVCSRKKARDLGVHPIARIAGGAVAGVDPRVMGIGPVPAIRKLMERTGVDLSKVGIIELNEAFAATVLAVALELDIDLAKVNLRGGAIALGHPLGCSGARILTTLLHILQTHEETFGLATMCIGVGQGIAMLLEKE